MLRSVTGIAGAWAIALAGSLVLGAAAPNVNEALLQMDFPAQAACVSAPFPKGNTAMKGIAIRVGPRSSMLFDTELMRMAAGWREGYLTTRGVAFDGAHGGHPSIDGEQIFGTPMVPGWMGEKDALADPRKEPFGPLGGGWAKWDGMYVRGMDVVLAYTVRGAKILEHPTTHFREGLTGFVRDFEIDRAREELTLLVCEVDKAVPFQSSSGNVVVFQQEGEDSTRVGVARLPRGGRLVSDGGKALVKIPKGASGKFRVVIWKGSKSLAGKFEALLEGDIEMPNVREGGSARWKEKIVTKGELEADATPDGAYVLDRLAPPSDNPWRRRVRFGGMDFFADGKRAALCTWDGDVWIVSGIDDKLENLTWSRFASGLYETLGLTIVNDVIYTSGRDQITKLHDFNKDGEADYYENFCNLYTSTEGFHEFVFDLQRDGAGNFYFAKAAPVRPGGSGFERISEHNGTLCKVSPDGSKLEVMATGFRAPNGIGVRADGQVTTGDNEGTWIPSCPINWIKPGGFYGVEHVAHKNPVPEFNPPLCWLSRSGWDNSGGGQAWVTSGKWGPFKDELLHVSYGECALYLVMRQAVGTVMQGGVVRLPLKFSSSAMRPKFNPVDGQLYVAGLQGWQTKAARMSGLDRVRFTGKPVHSVRGLSVDRRGVHLTFTQPLERAVAEDLESYSIQRWNYRRSMNYGSQEYSANNPDKVGRDKVEVKSARLSEDGRTVTLVVDDLKPVMQMQINYALKSADGVELKQSVQHTIHVVP